jgi:hypothetical protein
MQRQHKGRDAPVDRLAKGAVVLDESAEAHSQFLTVTLPAEVSWKNRGTECAGVHLTLRKK